MIKKILLLVLIVLLVCCKKELKSSSISQGAFNEEENSINQEKSFKIGDKVDSLNGVHVYYNGSVSHVLERHVSKDGYNLGLKYQCVEFVKRYYYEYYNHKMPNSYGHAKDFFNGKIADGKINPDRNLIQCKNSSQIKPKVGDLIIFDGHVFNPYGHVAIISKVERYQIEIIQQNPGPSGSSRETIRLKNNNNLWEIDKRDVLGWLTR